MDTDIKLINLIENNPCLYNKQNRDFKNRDEKLRVWEQIVEKCDLKDVQTAQNKWRYLRDKFVKEKKRRYSLALESHLLSDTVPEWDLFQHLKFLESFILSRKVKRKRCNNRQKTASENNDEYSYDDNTYDGPTDEKPSFESNYCFDDNKTKICSLSTLTTNLNEKPDENSEVETDDDNQYHCANTRQSKDGSSSMHFCMFLAAEMRKMSQEKRNRLQKAVMQILWDGTE